MKRFALAFVPLSLIGCANTSGGVSFAGFGQHSTTVGNGSHKEVSRSVEAYRKVVVGSAFQVEATEGPSKPLLVSADSNLLDSIKTEVKDNVLYVSIKGNVSSKTPFKLKLSTPIINGFDASGATKVNLKLQSRHEFELQGSGSSEVKIIGPISNLSCDLSGASRAGISTPNLGKVNVELSGASSLKMDGKLASLNADLSGASSLTGGISGNTLDIQLSGASNAVLGKFGSVAKELSGASSLKVN